MTRTTRSPLPARAWNVSESRPERQDVLTLGKGQRSGLRRSGGSRQLRHESDRGMVAAVFDQAEEIPHCAHAGGDAVDVQIDVRAIALFADQQALAGHAAERTANGRAAYAELTGKVAFRRQPATGRIFLRAYPLQENGVDLAGYW